MDGGTAVPETGHPEQQHPSVLGDGGPESAPRTEPDHTGQRGRREMPWEECGFLHKTQACFMV